MAFNLFDDPFEPPQQRFVDPRQDESFLGNMMEGSLGGLAYIGKVLDKTFGGRAVRGALGGNFDELLSVIPLSDTLGITSSGQKDIFGNQHQDRVVHGRQLTDSFGLTTPGDQSWENDAAEFATEVALDPGTWVGAAVPKLVARGGLAAGRAGGLGIEALTGGRANPFTFGGRMLENAKAPARALFDDAVGGAWMPKVQGVATDVFTPEIRAGGYQAEMGAADANVQLARLLEANPLAEPNAVRTAMTQAAEGLVPDAALSLQGLGYGPQQTADLLDLSLGLGERVRATRAAESAEGLTSKNHLDLSDWQLGENSAVEAQNAYIRQQNAAAAKAGLPPPPLMSEAPLPWEPQTQYVPRSANVFGEPPAWARRQGTGLGGASEFQISREDILRGIPGGTAKINQWSMSPELTGMNRLLPDPDVTQRIASDIFGAPVSQIPLDHPVYRQAAGIADMLKNLPDEALDRGLFNMDLVGNVKHRELDSVRNIASAKTAMAAIGRGFAKPIKDIMAEGQRAVSLPDFLDSMRLSATDDQGFKAAHLEAAKMLGIDPADFDKFKDYGLPMDVAKDLGRIGKAWSTPESLAPVVQAWDNAVNWFKRNLTVPFPGFHVRNLMSGVFNMWRDGEGAAGAISGPAGDAMMGLIRGREIPAEVAAKLYPGLTPQAASDEILKELVGGKLAFTRSGQAADRVTTGVGRGVMAEELPKAFQSKPRTLREDIGGFAETFKPKAGSRSYNPLNTETFAPTIAGEKVGNAVEDWIRGTHYISKRLAGESPEQAMESVLKYQIDYGKATEFEKNVMKRVMPWYSFSRGNLPPLLKDLAEKPAKLLGTTRAVTGTRESGEFVPPWVAEGAAVPLPGAPEGQKRFISSFGLPIEDEVVRTLGSAAHGDIDRVFQQLFGMSIPWAKLPAELATGTQMYSGRKLEELKPYSFADLGGLIPENYARQASQVIANTPASRVASTVDKFLDERKTTPLTLLNALTGVRVTDTDLERTKAAASLQLLKEELRGKPGVKMRENVVIPKDQREKLSPDDLLLLDLLQGIEKRSADRARQLAR